LQRCRGDGFGPEDGRDSSDFAQSARASRAAVPILFGGGNGARS
jgi:hypothetical protein